MLDFAPVRWTEVKSNSELTSSQFHIAYLLHFILLQVYVAFHIDIFIYFMADVAVYLFIFSQILFNYVLRTVRKLMDVYHASYFLLHDQK